MAITPQAGWMVDPKNPNGVIQAPGTIGTALTPTETPTKASEPSMLSSTAGLDALNKAKVTEVKLTPPTPAPTTPTTPTPEPTKGQYSFDEAYQLVGNNFQGVTQMGDGRYTLGPEALKRIGVQTAAQTELDTAKSQLEADKAKLRNISAEVANDPALISTLNNISAEWDQRIKETEDMNKSRVGAMGTAAQRLGMRWTGGSIGPTAGIISGEERAGADRVTSLMQQKNSALTQAKIAYENQQWDRYAKLVDLSDKKYQEAKKAITDLNATAIEQQKLIQQEREAVQKEEQQQFERSMKTIGMDSSAILPYLEGMTDEQQTTYLANIATLRGYDPITLKGAVEQEKAKSQQAEFDKQYKIESLQSTINNREAAAQRAEAANQRAEAAALRAQGEFELKQMKALQDGTAKVVDGKIMPTTPEVDTSMVQNQIALAKQSIKNATDLSFASGRETSLAEKGRKLFGATDYDELQAETNTVRSLMLTIATDPSIKKFFGPQMSNADVKLMMSAGTSLNPELQRPEKLKAELKRLDEIVTKLSGKVTDTKTPANKVLMTDPNGKPAYINADKVEEAKKRGFK